MKRAYFSILQLFFLVLLAVAGNDSNKVVLKTYKPENSHSFTAQFISDIISQHHYHRLTFNDELSASFLSNYLKRLDPTHSYFTQPDIAGFDIYKNTLDDDLRVGNVQAGFDIYNLYQKRLEERILFALDLLKGEMDFSAIDSFQYDRDEAPYVASMAELDALWKRKVAYEVLALKADGKEYKTCTDIVSKRYQTLYKQLAKTKNEDVFGYYINSLTELADPHTNYFPPKAAADFNMTMSLNLEGIGATLQSENEYTKIVRLSPGGPADKSKKIFPNDRIVAVGQGKKGEMVSILDWRIDDVVSQIRGKKGTIVRIEIIPHNSTNNKTKIVELVRDRIVLEDQASKWRVKEVTRSGKTYKMGVIDIPAFYLDWARMNRGESDYKSTTRDVRKIIDSLKMAKVDGIIIDLRNNGGGSLQEAVELTGLFIKTGPVVQVKEITATRSEDDRNPDVYWDGPLAVLVNRFSASASEIFAAAMQDYGRATIIGEQTFGKGTVQQPIDLNQYIQLDSAQFGQLHFTVAKFYRISGGSTQHRGVIPDVVFPSAYSGTEYGEGGSKFALPYDEIQAVKYSRISDLSPKVEQARQRSKERLKQNPEYQYLLEDIAEIEKGRKRQYVTLNEETYKADSKLGADRNKAREEARRKAKDAMGLKTDDTGKTDLIMDEAGEILLDVVLK